uniref:Uncharacterized protein n=1 Tax=Panagrolaimus sp. PS1159 TaxID=55785 RepID=A0AC35EYK2_9BILA
MAYLKITEEHARKFSNIKNASFPTRGCQPLLPDRKVEIATICTPGYHQLFKRVPFGDVKNEILANSISKSRLNRLNPALPWIYNRESSRDCPDITIGWEYLDISPNGKCLAVCSTINYKKAHTATVVESRHVLLNERTANDEKNRRLNDKSKGKKADSTGYNVLGIDFPPLDNSNSSQTDARVVEMVRAPFDTDVTCVLSVMAHGHYCKNPSTVNLKPLVGFSRPAEETDDQIGFDLYSKSWKMNEPSWSGAFDSRNLKIAVGLDNGSKLIDVMSSKQMPLPSNNKTVISQAFYYDGNLLFFGRQDDDVGIIDLRAHKRIASVLHGSKSAGFVAPLKTDPNHVITETFSGAINKWDLRSLKPSIIFEGHQNHHNKVPCHIDSKERFLFAVDDSGATRGWALDDGKLLCTIPRLDSPEKCSFFPRMVYSDNWGGQHGNAGILLALNKNFYLYDLYP